MMTICFQINHKVVGYDGAEKQVGGVCGISCSSPRDTVVRLNGSHRTRSWPYNSSRCRRVTLRRFYVTSCVVLVNILDLLHVTVPAGRLCITGLYSSTPGQVLIAIRGHRSVQVADQIFAAEGE